MTEDLVDRRVDDWRKRLIDLSHPNRLIAYTPKRATTLQIAAPSLLELLGDPERATSWSFYLPPEPEEEDADSEESTDFGATWVLLPESRNGDASSD